jgi:hypothetical protein
MKANEIRLGNYVYDTLGKVNKIDLDAITYIIKEPLNQVKPIPLTEEWLLKFGFEKKNDYYNRCYFSIDGMYIRKDDNEFETEVGECLYKTIYYVHQLQNLYFALNDEELTMK